MDQIKTKIPAAFIRSRSCVSWRDLQYGLANELLDEEAIIDFAVKQVELLPQPDTALLDLAAASSSDPVRGLVDQLAAREPQVTDAELRDKWLYLVLAWLYERRDAMADPLGAVEEVYADFEYPEAISGFVRYMPLDGPDLGSVEANEQRLIERWRRYLDSEMQKRSACLSK